MLLVWLFLPRMLELIPDAKINRTLAAVTIGLAALVSLPIAFHYMFVPGGSAVPNYLMGAIETPRYLAQRGLTTPVTRWVAANAAEEARIWTWCEDRTLYFDRWTRSDSPYGPPAFLELVANGGTRALDQQIRDHEIDYIVLRNDRCPEDWTEASFEKRSWIIEDDTGSDLELWAATGLAELQRDDRFILYRTNR
jgi:hypothetical protein